MTFETIDAVIERAGERLSENANLVDELERRGKEQQLIFKTMVMTGLRKKELSLVRLRSLDFEIGFSPNSSKASPWNPMSL